MKYIIIMIHLLFFIPLVADAQVLPADVCIIKDGDLEFTIDLRWTDKHKSELRNIYNLDSLMLEELFRGKRFFTIDGENWNAYPVDNNRILLKKPVQKKSFFESLFYSLFDLGNSESPGYVNKPVPFGFNKFQRQSVFVHGNQVTFFLYGYPEATNVVLSGSFNNWNTQSLKMQKKNNAWVATVNLEPGKYYYKFIADGSWIHDVNNLLTESDGIGGHNSVLFVTNYTFELSNYDSATNVVLSGSFNNWQHHDAYMLFENGKWQLPVYLANGTYMYKFIVDGKWITDPRNPVKIINEYLTYNSVLTVGEGVEFFLPGYKNAKNVYLSGSFNDWERTTIPMHQNDSGWQSVQFLNPGNYEYKFVVDDKWITDPTNHVIHGSGEFENSFLVHKPTHTFVLEAYPNATNVFVTGTFNNWIHHGWRMKRVGNHWELSLFIPKGKTKYKFIVDGEWITDPNNPEFEQNKFNTFDSVLWKE